jgi:regulator of replication initiation timing
MSKVDSDSCDFDAMEEIKRLHRIVDQTARENAQLRLEVEQLRYYNRLLSTHKEYDV